MNTNNSIYGTPRGVISVTAAQSDSCCCVICIITHSDALIKMLRHAKYVDVGKASRSNGGLRVRGGERGHWLQRRVTLQTQTQTTQTRGWHCWLRWENEVSNLECVQDVHEVCTRKGKSACAHGCVWGLEACLADLSESKPHDRRSGIVCVPGLLWSQTVCRPPALLAYNGWEHPIPLGRTGGEGGRGSTAPLATFLSVFISAL